jgi:predicted dehydrogenase
MNIKNKNPLKMAVIGAGARGTYAYAPHALKYPDQIQISAVAEPNEYRRKKFAEIYSIPLENQFESWESLLENHKCDAVIIANQDAGHFDPMVKSMKLGLSILMEKPVTNNIEEAREILNKIGSYDKPFLICHVLRYTPFFRELKKILDDNAIGELISIQHNENVGHFHQAHSFVRGHWRNNEESSPMILAKCCHDMDILNWLNDGECKKLSSFGSLVNFRKEKAPEGVPERCFDGCPIEKNCPYSAYRYLDTEEKGTGTLSFARVVRDHGETDDIKQALKTGPYGRCVYHCDNDVVDNQVVIMEYEGGKTTSLIMSAFTDKIGRTVKLIGVNGEIRGYMEKNEIEITDFRTGSVKTIEIDASGAGHGGGDEGTMREFISQIKNPDLKAMQKSNRQGILGHLMAFAAEESRLTNQVIFDSQF